ncbi:YdiY family protein [Kangiella sp. TOML190]|uniref:DUF481 domain-containing protein n=1 Tax=Kangiella sp. TOML190 TaxID=2931351 RepID=UPI00203E1FCA|nr:DUF481 domain-containing protein [Kangiella sp. TOML190]
MKLTKIFAAVAAVVSMGSVQASGLLADAPEEGTKGNIDLGFVDTSGNTNTTTMNGAFDYLIRVSDPYSMGFSVTGLNNSDDDERSAEKYTFAWNNRYDLSEKDFLYGTLDYVNDYFGAYDYQSGVYFGYGRQIFKDDSGSLSLGVAAGYRINKVFVGDDEKEGVLRGDLDYAYNISESATFTQKLTAIIGEEVDTYDSETALTAKLSDSLALKVAYLVTHNSKVPADRDKTDKTASVGVSYSF